MTGQVIVQTGNLEHGVEFIGPFPGPYSAHEYMAGHSEQGNYGIVPLAPPEPGFVEGEYPTPAYPLGHTFWVMRDNRPVECTLWRVDVRYSLGLVPQYVYYAKWEGCTISVVEAAAMAVTTKAQLLESL
jgi:hypothetical protein